MRVLDATNFEAVFWRGWVLLRLAESFGIVPAIVLGSRLYAAYHNGYGMDSSEMVIFSSSGSCSPWYFLYPEACSRSVLILWVVFQPMGQLVMLMQDRLKLSFLDTMEG